MLYAHYFKTNQGATLIICKSMRPTLNGGSHYAVTGKKHANQLAIALNAKPWNF